MNKNMAQVGGMLSILVGISYIAISITFFLTPVEQIQSDVGAFMVSMNEDSRMRTLYHLSWGLGAIFALGAVPAISETVKNGYEGWVKWTGTIAIVGYSVVAVGNLRAMAIKPLMAEAYVSGDPLFKTIIPTIDPWLLFDPQGWFGGAGLGIWILVVSIIGFKKTQFPKIMSMIGIIGALSLFISVVGAVIENPALNGLASALGGLICGPIWFIWYGVLMFKQSMVQVEEDPLKRKLSV